jgi:hypothetical protein
MGQRLKIHPISLKQANAFVDINHRHHKPSVGHKWSIGLMENNELVGVAIVGRPVSRHLDNGITAEVARLATNGITNGCSMLYGACARIAKEMGYHKIQTYILDIEPGTSLKASGWILEAISPGGEWIRNDGRVTINDQPKNPKQRWSKELNTFAQPVDK